MLKLTGTWIRIEIRGWSSFSIVACYNTYLSHDFFLKNKNRKNKTTMTKTTFHPKVYLTQKQLCSFVWFCFYFWSRGGEGSWRSPCVAAWMGHEAGRISRSVVLILPCRLEVEGHEWGEGTLDCPFPTSCPQAALLAMTASSLGSQLPLHRPGQLPVPGRLFSSSVPPSRQGGNFLRSPQHLLLTCRICYNLVNQLPVFQSWFKYANILCSLARSWIQPFANV